MSLTRASLVSHSKSRISFKQEKKEKKKNEKERERGKDQRNL